MTTLTKITPKINTLRQAEKALENITEFYNTQLVVKSDLIEKQAANYIRQILIESGFMCYDFKHKNLVLKLGSKIDRFIFFIGTNGNFRPIFSVAFNGKLHYINKPTEHEILTLIDDWQGFKAGLECAINIAVKEELQTIGRQIDHISHLSTRLARWRV